MQTEMLPLPMWSTYYEQGADAARGVILSAPEMRQEKPRTEPRCPYNNKLFARAWREGYVETMRNHRSGAPTGL